MPRPTTEFDPKGVNTVDPMIDTRGQRKKPCVGCGGPRDVEYAKTAPCFCCGSTGTQDAQPEFDQFGELVPAEVVAARKEADKQARIERLQQAREAKAAGIAAEVAPVREARPRIGHREKGEKIAKPQPEASRTSAVQPNAQVLPKPTKQQPSKAELRKAAAANLAALF